MLHFKYLRLIEKGWSQAELARHASLHPSTISRIETGMQKPYPSELTKIAAALDITEDEVMREVSHDGSSIAE